MNTVLVNPTSPSVPADLGAPERMTSLMSGVMGALVAPGPGDPCEQPISLGVEPMVLAGAGAPDHEPVGFGLPSQVVQLHGEHDLATVGDLAACLQAASTVPGDLVVDLGDVSFFDASTVAVLVRAHLDLEAGGRHLRLRAPTPRGRRILGLCGLSSLIESTSGIVAA